MWAPWSPGSIIMSDTFPNKQTGPKCKTKSVPKGIPNKLNVTNPHGTPVILYIHLKNPKESNKDKEIPDTG